MTERLLSQVQAAEIRFLRNVHGTSPATIPKSKTDVKLDE